MGEFGRFEIVIFLLLGLVVASTHAHLEMNFYKKTCPKAEEIVRDYVDEHIPHAPSIAAALLRLHFHDCFVRGCDASVLLEFTPSAKNKTERVSPPNLTLRGFSVIDNVKSRLEAECPGVVSCADILSLVARDAIVKIGGPYWHVPTGRRDGTVSRDSDPLNYITFPTDGFLTLRDKFKNKGLNLKDLVVLSGAHTIGVSLCTSFTNRLYNFTGMGDQDPTLNSAYAAKLKAKCPSINSTGRVEMDPGSKRTFDLSYYTNVLKHRGLFVSDAALLTNSTTKSYITQLVKRSDNLVNFYNEFANSMEKMGRIQVKTGTAGEIRKNCAFVNS